MVIFIAKKYIFYIGMKIRHFPRKLGILGLKSVKVEQKWVKVALCSRDEA